MQLKYNLLVFSKSVLRRFIKNCLSKNLQYNKLKNNAF